MKRIEKTKRRPHGRRFAFHVTRACAPTEPEKGARDRQIVGFVITPESAAPR